MNCLWLLLLGQALVVVRNERETADPAQPASEPEPIEDEESVEPTDPEKDEDDEDADFVEEVEEEEPVKPAKRADWLPACPPEILGPPPGKEGINHPELKGDPTCRLSLTVKRQEHWVSGDTHELYLRGDHRGSTAKGAMIATANGFTRLNKKVTIEYKSGGKLYKATLKRDYCQKNTVCKLKCKGNKIVDVDEINKSPVDALTYTLCDLGDRRGPTTIKMFYNQTNPKLDTIVRMTYGVFGSRKFSRRHWSQGGGFVLKMFTDEIHKLFPYKISSKNGVLSDGTVDPANPSKFIPKPKGQVRYSAQNLKGIDRSETEISRYEINVYFVDVHSPWSAIDAFAYSLAMADNSADHLQGIVEDAKAGIKKMFGKKEEKKEKK